MNKRGAREKKKSWRNKKMLTWNDIIAQIKHKKVIKRDNIENGEEEKKLIWINFNITVKYSMEILRA